jgi:hypothetical protein
MPILHIEYALLCGLLLSDLVYFTNIFAGIPYLVPYLKGRLQPLSESFSESFSESVSETVSSIAQTFSRPWTWTFVVRTRPKTTPLSVASHREAVRTSRRTKIQPVRTSAHSTYTATKRHRNDRLRAMKTFSNFDTPAH